MICRKCSKTAESLKQGLITPSEAKEEHSICKGNTHCDCQHRVDAQVQGKSIKLSERPG
jgi:hypothetical protein